MIRYSTYLPTVLATGNVFAEEEEEAVSGVSSSSQQEKWRANKWAKSLIKCTVRNGCFWKQKLENATTDE